MSGQPALDAESAWAALDRLPRARLAEFPTPLRPWRRLGAELGLAELWCKRDDLIDFGLGGNKLRGLEFLLADAQAQGADTLVTGAGPQSNHVRATAAVAAHAGLRCLTVFWGESPAEFDGNYRLTRLLGVQPCFTGDADRASVDAGIEHACAHVRRRGEIPYAIPRGGACALGALGHVLAAKELDAQCRALGIAPDAVVMATGSGGTHAGWLLGSRLLGAGWRVESFTVSRDVEAARLQVARLASEAAGLLGLSLQFSPHEALVHGGFIGPGYGIPSREAAAAIQRVARSEGVLLDPVYTGKAMAGLLHHRKRGMLDGDCIVFLHTGGEPAFFAGDGSWLLPL